MQENNSPWIHLRGLEPLSLCDWPGKTSAVLFLGGCNFLCPTCHNAKLAWQMDTLAPISKNELRHFLETKSDWLDGITVTGGEPTTVENIEELFSLIKEFKLPIKLDTNGSNPQKIKSLLENGLIDCAAIDVKAPFHMYPQVTGGSFSEQNALDAFQEIFALATEMPDKIYFRTTCVPALTEEDLNLIQALIPPTCSWKKQTFIPPESFIKKD